MIYRLTLDLAFTQMPPIDQVKPTLKLLFREGRTINPGMPNAERGFITIARCYHDESPTKPCEIIEHVETNP